MGKYQYQDSNQSYYFANYASEWGWGTWRRAWNLYDFEISAWEDKNIKKIIKQTFDYSKPCKEYLCNIFDKTYKNPNVTWWDYQWAFTRYINSGIAIVPAKNLVCNIGFGEDATHTFDVNSRFNKISIQEMVFPLNYPTYIALDKDLEKELIDAHYPPRKKRIVVDKIKSKLRKIKQWIKKYL